MSKQDHDLNFDLDKAVRQWCELVLSSDSIKNKNIDELKDHLFCVVESYTSKGGSPKEIFEKAITKMGEVDLLAGKYDKNRIFFNKLCAFEYAIDFLYKDLEAKQKPNPLSIDSMIKLPSFVMF